MKELKRYDCSWTADYGPTMKEFSTGDWVRYDDVQAYIKEFVEIISVPWNIQLTSGGALNETSGKKSPK